MLKAQQAQIVRSLFPNAETFLQEIRSLITKLEQAFASTASESWTRNLVADHIPYVCDNEMQMQRIRRLFECAGATTVFYTTKDLLTGELSPYILVKLKEPIISTLIGDLFFFKLCLRDNHSEYGIDRMVFTTVGAPMFEYISNMTQAYRIEFQEIKWHSLIHQTFEAILKSGLKIHVVPFQMHHKVPNQT